MKPRAPADKASTDSREKKSFEGLKGAIKDSTWQQTGNNFGNNEVQQTAVIDSRWHLRLSA